MNVDPAYMYWFICAVKFVQDLLDGILDLLFGYTTKGGSRDERKLSENYENSAQIVDVFMAGCYSAVAPHKLRNFFYNHVKYVNPDVVLKNDNITILSVSR